MPSSRHARMTRIAISPRLATRTLLKSLLFILQRTLLLFNWSAHSQQGLVGADDLALLDVDLAHATGDRRDDIVLHLHRLEDRDHVAELHLVAGFHRDLDYQSLHRRDHQSLPDPGRWRGPGPKPRAGARRDGHPRARDANLEDLSLDLDLELGRRDRLGGRSIRGTGRDGRRSGRGGGLGSPLRR